MTAAERYPCIDPPYSSQMEAEVARLEHQGRFPREVWRCTDLHWHEGELS